MMIVVNSVCGCAAGKARPGIAMALLQNERKPQHVGTVFAGADIEATERARELHGAVSAVVAVGGALPRRQAGVHDAAPRHRDARRRGHRHRT